MFFIVKYPLHDKLNLNENPMIWILIKVEGCLDGLIYEGLYSDLSYEKRGEH